VLLDAFFRQAQGGDPSLHAAGPSIGNMDDLKAAWAELRAANESPGWVVGPTISRIDQVKPRAPVTAPRVGGLSST